MGSFFICYPFLDITQAVVTMKLTRTVYNGSTYRHNEESGASTVSPTQKSFVTESAPLENYENNKSVIVLNDGILNDEAMDNDLGDETGSDVILKDDIMRDEQIVIINDDVTDNDVMDDDITDKFAMDDDVRNDVGGNNVTVNAITDDDTTQNDPMNGDVTGHDVVDDVIWNYIMDENVTGNGIRDNDVNENDIEYDIIDNDVMDQGAIKKVIVDDDVIGNDIIDENVTGNDIMDDDLTGNVITDNDVIEKDIDYDIIHNDIMDQNVNTNYGSTHINKAIMDDDIINTVSDINNDTKYIVDAHDTNYETVEDGSLIHDKACIQGPTVDDWQTVSENLTYVYSAHLDPDSSETRSGIHIVGSIMGVYTQQPKYSSLVSDYYCRVWARSQSQEETEVFTAHVTAITGRGYTFGL